MRACSRNRGLNLQLPQVLKHNFRASQERGHAYIALYAAEPDATRLVHGLIVFRSAFETSSGFVSRDYYSEAERAIH